MCGIAGCFYAGEAGTERGGDVGRPEAGAGRMAAALAHRGPDDAGIWMDQEVGLALAHRRLAIIDLSPAGSQPMISASGRFVIVFNGEIYNHLELRQQVGGHAWRGHSDTETLLAAVDAWGLEVALARCVGMFALALWDRRLRVLTLARDRLGEKPLYYGWQDGVFLFGSELKALRAHPAFRGEIDRAALALFLRYNYVPTPWSIYHGIRKLPPGAFLLVRSEDRGCEPTLYWSARTVAEEWRNNPFVGSDEEAREELERILRRAVAGQMVADVPLGAFLSGGIDSSAIVALMQARSDRPVKTFTMGFSGIGYDEAEHAAAVARHLGTEHTELYVQPEDALAIIPRLPLMYDEPFADSSQIPTFMVAELARRHVTVALSGDGGDELFGGYNRYFWAENICRRAWVLPYPLRRVLAGIVTFLPPHVWDAIFACFSGLLPSGWHYANPGDKLHKLAEIIPARSMDEVYSLLISHWKYPQKIVVDGSEPVAERQPDGYQHGGMNFPHRMMYQDLVSYLPDDILVKVDRAAMAVSLETRIPMLDHRVVEFAWRLPLAMKIRNGQGKWLLRQMLYKYVPRELVERPKMGFGVPLDAWLRGPLRPWAEELLDDSRLQREGFLRCAPIRHKWREHLSGRRNWAYHLWGVLMFQAWLEHNR
ncbi:MAG: asparagine synthase (glutamine-hydrolyzing) [Thermodesulfobacteriota bacterium]